MISYGGIIILIGEAILLYCYKVFKDYFVLERTWVSFLSMKPIVISLSFMSTIKKQNYIDFGR